MSFYRQAILNDKILTIPWMHGKACQVSKILIERIAQIFVALKFQVVPPTRKHAFNFEAK